MRRLLGALLVAALAGVVAGPGPAVAQVEDVDGEFRDNVLLRADEVRYDQQMRIATATGNVEINQGARLLRADTVSYNQNTDIVTASGNVVLVEPTGEVLFSEWVELSGDLRQGAIRGIRLVLDEHSRVAASGGRRVEGRITEMRNAVFSSCDLCEDDPDADPLWQVKAVRVIHDQQTRDIIYNDAWLEVFGVPVAYTPYFSHPDPTVERRSGFLSPAYGSSSTLGLTLEVPYYFNLAPNRDATFAPIFTTDEGVVLTGEYRARQETGHYGLEGSVTYTDARDNRGRLKGGDDFRWAIKGDGEWDYDDTWRYGFDLYRSSDDTYLSRYGFDDANVLTSDAYVEGFRGRSYASAIGYVWQGLRQSDDPGQTPVVAPLLDYHFVSEPLSDGDHVEWLANGLVLTRNDGTDQRRFSLGGAYERPLITDGGHVFALRGALRYDGYWENDVPLPGQGTSFNGYVDRIWPTASLEWRYPLVRTTGNIQQVIEPIVMGVWSPNGGNPAEIANEDSQDFEFDEINLFSEDRYPGFDRVEGGFRVNYGLKAGVYGASGGRSEVLFGQVWRLQDDDTFSPATGLDGNFSDYVGRVLVSPGEYIDMLYRFRIDEEDLAFRRNELGLGLGPSWARLNTAYVQLKDDPNNVVDTVGEREQITFVGILKVEDEWTLRGRWREDLKGSGTLSYGAGITYENECIIIDGGFVRNFFIDSEANPDLSFLITVHFKGLN